MNRRNDTCGSQSDSSVVSSSRQSQDLFSLAGVPKTQDQDSEPPSWAVERAKEIAESIFAEWQASCARYPEGYPSPMGPIVEHHIASALAIPDGHVRLPSGEDVKVLGTLPMTADRCVVVWGSPVFFDDGQGVRLASVSLVGDQTGHGGEYVGAAFPARKTHMSCPDQCPIDKCYSTRAAAESARAAKETK